MAFIKLLSRLLSCALLVFRGLFKRRGSSESGQAIPGMDQGNACNSCTEYYNISVDNALSANSICEILLTTIPDDSSPNVSGIHIHYEVSSSRGQQPSDHPSGQSSQAQGYSPTTSQKEQGWFEDSYGLNEAQRLTDGIYASDDEEFMMVYKETVLFSRVMLSPILQEQARERAMLIFAHRTAIGEQVIANDEAEMTSVKDVPDKPSKGSQITGRGSGGMVGRTALSESFILKVGSPLYKSSPLEGKAKSSLSYEARVNYYKITAQLDFSSLDEDTADAEKQDKCVSLTDDTVSHVQISGSSDEEIKESMNETDNNMNLQSVLNISSSYFAECFVQTEAIMS